MNNQEQMEKLWQHVTAQDTCISPCMEAVHAALLEAARMNHRRPMSEVARRIAENNCEFEHYGAAFIVKVSGEWHITNSDMLLWADLAFFGRRDFFPNNWGAFSREVDKALSDKRTWQTFERYMANGGLNDDHRKLLARLIWDINPWRGDSVSLYVQGKRPFGNSSRELDMVEILEWQFPPEDEDIPDEMNERCWELFDELQFAIGDALAR